MNPLRGHFRNHAAHPSRTREQSTIARHAFLWALVISLLLHLLLLSGLHRPHWLAQQPPPLQVRLLALPAPPRSAPASAPRAAVRRATTRRPSRHRIKPRPPVQRPAPLAIPQPVPGPALSTPALRLSKGGETPPPPQPPPSAANVAHFTGLTELPQHYEIQYDLLLGENGPHIGRASYVWQADASRYVLVSIAEARGLLALFRSGRLEQISTGHVGPQGLLPDDFEIQRGDDSPAHTTHVHIAANRQSASVDHQGRQFNETAPPGAQDILSVIFQIALTAKPGQDETLQVTSGKDFNPYRLHWAGETTVDTPLGRLRALHLILPASGDTAGMEIWLASDFNHAPIKIVYVDERFGPIIQIVAGMNTGPQNLTPATAPAAARQNASDITP